MSELLPNITSDEVDNEDHGLDRDLELEQERPPHHDR
jgi:hypothetical protein